MFGVEYMEWSDRRFSRATAMTSPLPVILDQALLWLWRPQAIMRLFGIKNGSYERVLTLRQP
jgi:hypothetical protein